MRTSKESTLSTDDILNIQDRFFSRVNPGMDCWEWSGCLNRGYGFFGYKRKYLYAHRASWMIHFGKIPENMFVCHHCDNPKCVNPNHLFLGTCVDNNKDRKVKGGYVAYKGEDAYQAKLSTQDVINIRTTHKGVLSSTKLSRMYGVSRGTIENVIYGKTWKHVQC